MTETRQIRRRRRWSLAKLEQLARDHAGLDAEADEERTFLLDYLREFADGEGRLPLEFDPLARKTFGVLLEAPAAGPARRRRQTPAATPAPRRRLDLSKKILLAAILVGLIAWAVGGSTFASFSAQTTNPGSAFSSGTLTLSDQVSSGTACNSYGGASQDNYNAGCNAILALANAAPGVTGGQAKLTIANTGSLDASLFSVFAPYVNATLNSSVASGATVGSGKSVTSFTVTPLEGPVSSGDRIVLAFGSVTQQFCAGASAAAGATSIAISGGYPAGSTGSCSGVPPTTTAGTTFAAGTRVEDTSSDTTAANTDCYDQKTTTPGVAGATKGSDLDFNPTAGNPFCSSALLWIQEQSTVGANTYDYCWFGRGSPYGDQGNAEDANGQCRTPTTLALSGTYASGQAGYTLTVSPLTGNIRSGDTVTLAENGTTTTCSAGATYYIGATSVSLGSCSTSGSATTFDGSASAKDATAFTALNGSNPSSTISSFDTAHSPGAPISLPPLTGNGTDEAGSSVELAKKGGTGGVGDTRVFYVGVYFPAPPNTNENYLQGLLSTFGLTWHIDQ